MMPAPGAIKPTMPAPGKVKPTMPAPTAVVEKPLTFGDRRPNTGAPLPSSEWPPLAGKMVPRHLKQGCEFPEIQTYRQTNGDNYLYRFQYNKTWVAGVGVSDEHTKFLAQQFYMNETAQGRAESEVTP